MLQIGKITLESPVILAPMAGVTDFPFRQTVRQFGRCGLVVSEMTASRAIIESFRNPMIRKRMHFFDAEKEPAPVSIQIVGYDPDIMADAAAFNEQLGASIIDINMGCPVKKVVHTDSGAALMKDEKLAYQIIAAVVRAVQIPVTVKMRLGWDNQHRNAITIAKLAEEAGARAITVHARTRAQFYEGSADWMALRPIQEAIHIPLIANGDIRSPEDAHRALEASGAKGVMIGRGACGQPWLLRQVADALDPKPNSIPFHTPSMAERRQIIQQHLVHIIGMYGEEKGVLLARKHLGWYSKGIANSAEFRLAINSTVSYNKVQDMIDAFFHDAQDGGR